MSSICVIEDDGEELTPEKIEIIAAERIDRKKYSGNFPMASLKYLKTTRPEVFNNLASITSNCYYDKLESIEKKIIPPMLSSVIDSIGGDKLLKTRNPQVREISHHLCHLHSALIQYPFDESLIFVIDGVGSQLQHHDDLIAEENIFPKGEQNLARESVSVYHQKGKDIECVYKEWEYSQAFSCLIHKGQTLVFGNSFGNIYSATAHQIFGDWKVGGKVMGLSSFGIPDKDTIDNISEPYEFLDRVVWKENYKALSKNEFDHLSKEEFLSRANLAASTQYYHDNRMTQLFEKLTQRFPNIKNITMLGGCALNCLTNDLICRKFDFEKIYIPPNPDDTGIATGAAVHGYLKNKNNLEIVQFNKLIGSLGPLKNEFNLSYESTEDWSEFKSERLDSLEIWCQRIVEIIMSGEFLPIAFGRSEVGPRALGNRSILANPLQKEIKSILNNKVKHRESFRPYGIMILQSEVSKYFHVSENYQSPFMSFAPIVKKEYRELLKEVITPNHTIRIQTVTEATPHTYKLLKHLEEIQKPPILINTSLNVMGKPILEDEKDFYNFMKSSNCRFGVLGGTLLQRSQKP